MDIGLTTRQQIISTIDEIEGLLAKLIVQEQVDKSTKVLQAMAKGRRVGMALGLMIEREADGHRNR